MVLTEELVLRVLADIKIEPRKFAALYVFRNSNDIFKALVVTILTQNTNDKNALRAYENLVRIIGDITPEKLVNIGEDALANAIKPAGMHRIRARKIIELSRVILENYRGDLTWIKDLPLDEARKALLELPGVGEKTADVILVNLGKLAFPVDTHITRISIRLGIAKSRNYHEIQRAWMRILTPDPSRYLEIHLKLIQFGRDICIARNPRCDMCGFREVCTYYISNVRGKDN
ncbi:MAG: endonuclease III domain-containing protein [Vulcanisaeta sp.]|jgi:endonuclease-3|uniref:DNA-(Apurinic or apyrimidinic site) lyase n=1 Tax=Vulcanisaeta moutnovskia (strain 768-28) TaxID=985053 RepID=F0QVX6_VULM7|nr:endonuclease III [Vulcanisaeta moutnovskia]ADY00900.1 DNA-(apurinic or apyrimidinic site) lyase [Vulcanisaeta moutnovskia 768-28]